MRLRRGRLAEAAATLRASREALGELTDAGPLPALAHQVQRELETASGRAASGEVLVPPTAITLYTLVMASLMITGGKIGQMIGRKRAFSIGCVVSACGSLTTALSQSLPMLMIGWSLLEGLGAVLIMPAIVALVASNFAKPERPRAYGLVAAAGAIAAALGPLVGGLFTTYASWRWVFAGEVLIVLVILLVTRRMNDTPAEAGARLDLVGTALSALALGTIVLGILKALAN